MGWTGRSVTGTPKEMIIEELEWSNGTVSHKVLDISVKSGVAYAAVELKTFFKNGKPRSKPYEIYAVVVLFRKRKYEFTTKLMSECCGPYYYGCPKRILGLLTPTSNTTALEWRKECRDRAAKLSEIKASKPTLAVGDEVILDVPLSFHGGYKEKHFTVEDPKRNRFYASFGLCRFRRDTLTSYGYTVKRNGKVIYKAAA